MNKKNNGTLGLSCEPSKGEIFDYKYAKKLCKALQSKRKIYRKVNLYKWKLSFKKLRINDEVKKSDIKEVLNWYILHINDDGVPEAFSAVAFREKFDQIAAAMNRHKKENWPVVTTRVEDGQEAIEVDYG